MFIPGPDDAIWALVLGEQGIQLVAKGAGYVLVRGGKVLSELEARLAIRGAAGKVEKLAAKGVDKHHTVPKEILKNNLPEDVANNPAVRGKKGAPNRWPVARDKHKDIHKGPGGGRYNERFKEELRKLRRNPTAEDVTRIRDALAKEFGIEGCRP